jgi:hypothetical protein
MRSPASTARTSRHPLSPLRRPATPPQNPRDTVPRKRTQRIASFADIGKREDSEEQQRRDTEEEEGRLRADDLDPLDGRERSASSELLGQVRREDVRYEHGDHRPDDHPGHLKELQSCQPS